MGTRKTPRKTRAQRIGVVTSTDLAKKLGVSRATVSIVLNGQAEQRKISPETTRRVLEAARAVHYVPNQVARNLRLRRSDIIGVIIANFSADWAEQFLTGMLGVLDQTRFTPFVATHRFDAARHGKEVRASSERRDEALICQPIPGQATLYQQVMAAGTPLLFLGDYPPEMQDANYIVWDSAAAVTAAIRHLIDVGRRRIAFLGVDYPMAMSRARHEAFVKAVTDADLPVTGQLTYIAPIAATVDEILTAAYERFFGGNVGAAPDAIFCLNDGLALPLLERLDTRGIRVPAQVAVMGMGDLPYTGYTGIGLSTVREPISEMGQAAAHAVLQMIERPNERPIQQAIQAVDVRVRRTTAGH